MAYDMPALMPPESGLSPRAIRQMEVEMLAAQEMMLPEEDEENDFGNYKQSEKSQQNEISTNNFGF